MPHFCDNGSCENEAVDRVPVSVNEAHDEKRRFCGPCQEAYTIGVQHGRFHEAARFGCKSGCDCYLDKPKSFAFHHVHTLDHCISMMVGASSYRHAAQIVAEVIAENDPPGTGGVCCVEKLCAPENGGTGYYGAMAGRDQWFDIRPNQVQPLSKQAAKRSRMAEDSSDLRAQAITIVTLVRGGVLQSIHASGPATVFHFDADGFESDEHDDHGRTRDEFDAALDAAQKGLHPVW